MARYLIAFLLVILCCATNSFAAVTTNKWQQESTATNKAEIPSSQTQNVHRNRNCDYKKWLYWHVGKKSKYDEKC
jgi:hypothetical protein